MLVWLLDLSGDYKCSGEAREEGVCVTDVNSTSTLFQQQLYHIYIDGIPICQVADTVNGTGLAYGHPCDWESIGKDGSLASALNLLVCCSQMYAMYALVMFYHCCEKELRPLRPLPKFLCIKAVVFFSFYQDMLIRFLIYSGVIKATAGEEGWWSTDDISHTLQDYLICVEMFFAALAHHFYFSWKDYMPHDDAGRTDIVMAFMDSSLPVDVMSSAKFNLMTKYESQSTKNISALAGDQPLPPPPALRQ